MKRTRDDRQLSPTQQKGLLKGLHTFYPDAERIQKVFWPEARDRLHTAWDRFMDHVALPGNDMRHFGDKAFRFEAIGSAADLERLLGTELPRRIALVELTFDAIGTKAPEPQYVFAVVPRGRSFADALAWCDIYYEKWSLGALTTWQASTGGESLRHRIYRLTEEAWREHILLKELE